MYMHNVRRKWEAGQFGPDPHQLGPNSDQLGSKPKTRVYLALESRDGRKHGQNKKNADDIFWNFFTFTNSKIYNAILTNI